MAGKSKGSARAVILLLAVFFAAQAFVANVAADDAEMLGILPGEWTYEAEALGDEDAGENVRLALTLQEDGQMLLYFEGENGGFSYTWEGQWAFEVVSGGMDRLTLRFTGTDDPGWEENAMAECVYEAYMESWVENATEYTYLILSPVEGSGLSPFETVYGYDDLALHREYGPNMRVAHCDSFVSLREKRSTSSARILKVPLGEKVLAYPEYGEENGFYLCVYQGEYGYILTKYLEPME